MNFLERLGNTVESLATALILAISGGVLWLVRRVLTSQAQIELLSREISHRDRLRSEDREAMAEVRDDVKALRTDVGKLLGRKE